MSSHQSLDHAWTFVTPLTSPEATERARVGPAANPTFGWKGRNAIQGGRCGKSSGVTGGRSRDWRQGISEPRDRLPCRAKRISTPPNRLATGALEITLSLQVRREERSLGNPVPRNGARRPSHQLEFQGRNSPMKRVNPQRPTQGPSR